MHTNELMIYRNLDYGKILRDMTFLIEHEGEWLLQSGRFKDTVF